MANFNKMKEIRKILYSIPEDVFSNDVVTYSARSLSKYYSGYCLMVGFKNTDSGLPPLLCIEAYPDKTFTVHIVSFANRLPENIEVIDIQDIQDKCTTYLKLIGLKENANLGNSNMFLRWITLDGNK